MQTDEPFHRCRQQPHRRVNCRSGRKVANKKGVFFKSQVSFIILSRLWRRRAFSLRPKTHFLVCHAGGAFCLARRCRRPEVRPGYAAGLLAFAKPLWTLSTLFPRTFRPVRPQNPATCLDQDHALAPVACIVPIPGRSKAVPRSTAVWSCCPTWL